MDKKFCNYCRSYFLLTSKHWYKDRIYFKCKRKGGDGTRAIRLKKREEKQELLREEERKIEAKECKAKEKSLKRLARLDFKREERAEKELLQAWLGWTPLDWKNRCSAILERCIGGRDAAFVKEIRDKTYVTKKQWNWFNSLYELYVGPVDFCLLAKQPNPPRRRKAAPTVIPSSIIVTRYDRYGNRV